MYAFQRAMEQLGLSEQRDQLYRQRFRPHFPEQRPGQRSRLGQPSSDPRRRGQRPETLTASFPCSPSTARTTPAPAAGFPPRPLTSISPRSQPGSAWTAATSPPSFPTSAALPRPISVSSDEKGRILGGGLLLVLIGVWFIYFWRQNHPANRPASPKTRCRPQNAAVANALANQNTNTVAIIQSNFARVSLAAGQCRISAPALPTPPAGPPSPLQFTNFAPAIVAGKHEPRHPAIWRNVWRQSRRHNPEITSQLSGKNPKHINFLNADAGMRVNDNGELVDPVGHAVFFPPAFRLRTWKSIPPAPTGSCGLPTIS